MPPQKKGAKEQTKQTEKINKQLGHVQQFLAQEIDSSDEDNNSVREKIKPEDSTSNQRRPQRASSKDDAPLRQQTTTRTRGQQAAAVAASITPTKIVPSKKIDVKIETQQVNKNNGKVTPMNSNVIAKKDTNIIPIIPHSSRFISKNTDNKPAENPPRKNLIDLSSLEESLDMKKKYEGALKTSKQLGLDDIPLRQARKTTSMEQNKPSQLPKQQQSSGFPLRQQNQSSSPIKLIKTTPMKGKITEIEESKKKEANSVNISELKKTNVPSGDKKQLTANELQAMSKLLSIQADGLKIKQQQQQQQQFQQYSYNQQQINRQYNANSGFGEQPLKKMKMDYSSPFFTATTSSNHIIVGDNDTDTPDIEEIDDSQFDSRETDQQSHVDSSNIFPIDQQRLVQCGPSLSLGNITPQSKSFNLQQQQKQQQQQRACSYLQTLSSLGPQPPRPALGKATPIQGSAAAPIQITGKTTPIMQMNPGNKLTTPLRSFPGKATPMTTSVQEQPQPNTWGGKATPLNGKVMPNNGKITPLQRINTTFFNTQQLQQQQQIQQQKQEQQHTLIDIETEIQSRIESIKNEIGPLLACLNSDFIGGGGESSSSGNQPSRPSVQQPNNQLLSSSLRTPPLPLMSESRIYQDMRDRRMHADAENRTVTPSINAHNNSTILPSTAANTRNFTPNVSTNRNPTPNLSQIHRNITPTRMPAQTRIGDWVCANCKNLNFSYRAACNRCCLSQADNQLMIRNTNNNENIFMSSCNNLLKKTPIRTVEDVKRTFQDGLQNKENMNMSNFPSKNVAFQESQKPVNNSNHFQNNQDSSKLQENQNNSNNVSNNAQPKQTSTYGQNKGKRSTLSYKQLQEMGFENDPVIKIPSLQSSSNNSSGQSITIIEDNNANNNNNIANTQAQQSCKEITNNITSGGLVTHKIVFIDNSSAAPIVEISKKEQMKNQQESSQALKEANKRISVDPRVQMR